MVQNFVQFFYAIYMLNTSTIFKQNFMFFSHWCFLYTKCMIIFSSLPPNIIPFFKIIEKKRGRLIIREGLFLPVTSGVDVHNGIRIEPSSIFHPAAPLHS